MKLIPKSTKNKSFSEMGRTGRLRRRCQTHVNYNISCDIIFINLVKWMRKNSWIPSCDLHPVSYEECGRGLMTKKPVKKGDTLFSVPYHLLITTDVIEDSPVACIFHSPEMFKAQDVFSLFLIWEKHRGSQSLWCDYIKSLPICFTLPLFCTSDELVLLPSFIVQMVLTQKEKIMNSYKSILKVLKTLQICLCGRECSDLLSVALNYDDFLWAWSVVNTRSVFCQNISKRNCSIKIIDRNCIALAPLLDMFNHSNESDLKAELSSEGYYKIIATSPIQKYSQVFIHYGHHSNLHLYLEYGFVIPNNMYDVLVFTMEEVLNMIKELYPLQYNYSNAKKNFISTHNLYKDLICTKEGMSFNIKALVFLITSQEKKSDFQKKIYSFLYNEHETTIINTVCKKLIKIKILEFNSVLDAMNRRSGQNTKNFGVAKCLIKEFLNMLTKAQHCSEILQ